ncbi:MAG: hypothetical protein ABIA12_01195 [Candidatus Aenigmatarchaeota archaeon]
MRSKAKGVVNVIELMIVVVTLFVSFSIFFPGNIYRNKWDDAYGMLKARDAMLALERSGHLHEYAFSGTQMDGFLESLFSGSNVIVWHSVSGGIKEETRIACDCPAETVAWLNNWAGSTVLNNRDVAITFCQASINPSEPCFANSDALLVWKYKPLQPYESALADYVSMGGGVVEVMNFTEEAQVDGDSVQTGMFGLDWIDLVKDDASTCEFSRTPRSASDIIYEPYKYFHHVPITITIAAYGQTIAGCSYNPTGNVTLVLKSNPYEFDTCGPSSVLFDTHLFAERDTILVGGSDIMLNYVNSVSSVSVSFKAGYVFEDFLGYIAPPGTPDPPGKAIGINRIVHIEPADGNADRVLVRAVAGPTKYPAVILNTYGSGRTAWMPEPGKNGYGHDEKALLASLLLWSANKETSSVSSAMSSFRAGYMASYINVKNYDMFEIYKLNVGIGYPV